MKNKKKRALALVVLIAMLSGCGKKDAIEDLTVSATAEDKIESNSGLDQSKGRLVGESSKWDGYFVDEYGIKLKPGMTVNEIVEQGCVVFPDYEDDFEMMKTAPAGMCVSPDYNSSGNQVLYIFKEVDGSYRRSDYSEDVWFINPYPYAVPFGECIVSFMLPGLTRMGIDWNTDDKDSMSPEELMALFDIAPYKDEYDNYIYPYEDYFLSFDLYEGYILMVDAMVYGASEDYRTPECLKDFIHKDYEEWEEGSENLDTSLEKYSFKMGLGTQTIDLSYFESIEEFNRSYLTESDYTEHLHIKGQNASGDTVVIDLEDGNLGLFYKDVAHLSYYSSVEGEELPGGDKHYANEGLKKQNIGKIANNTIKLDISVDTGKAPEVEHTMEVYHQVEGLISTATE